MLAFDPDRFSSLIGSIYDCAIDPDLWPKTMGQICAELGGYSAGIFVLDFEANEPGTAGDRLVRDFGPPSDWDRKLADVFGSLKQIHRPFLGRRAPQLDEPILLPRDSGVAAAHFNEPAHRQWAEPQGIHQVMEAVALAEPRRLGLFSVTRQVTKGEFTDGDIALLRRLAPHIRRAITISDLLDIKRLETQALKAALDGLATGVVIVGEDARILHANESATGIMAGTGALSERRGHLTCSQPRQSRELLGAIEKARGDEATLGGQGIGIALSGAEGPVVATVLPLARGDVRTRLVPMSRMS